MEPQNNNPRPEGSNATPGPVESGTSLSPNNEEKFYREQDLFYKKRGLTVSIAGFALIILGLFVNIFQSEKVAKSIRANIENEIVTRVTDLDQIFIKNPDWAPYFYKNAPIDKEDPKYPSVSATAVMVLDVFDLVATQNRHYPEFWDTPEAWDQWMIDTFSTSPILRETFDKYPCWYGKSLWDLRQQGELKSGGKATQIRVIIYLTHGLFSAKMPL